MSTNAVASVVFASIIVVLLFVVYNKNYADADALPDKNDMKQQPSEHDYRGEFREVLGRHLTTGGNSDSIKKEIEAALKRSTFTRAPSKGRIGWIGDHFKVGNLKGVNKLIIKDTQSVYYDNPDKLTIGAPYSEQVIFLKNDEIFYLEELSDIDNLAGFIAVIFTRNHIYYLDLDTSLGRYFVRLEPS